MEWKAGSILSMQDWRKYNGFGCLLFSFAIKSTAIIYTSGKIAQFLTFLIILKMSLCGVTTYLYLWQMNLSKGVFALFLSTGYSLMGYNILQCSNIM